MLDDFSQRNKLSQKILAVFLCSVVLLSSLGISAQPANAQVEPFLDFTIFSGELTAVGENFPEYPNGDPITYKVTLTQDRGNKVRLDPVIAKNGKFFFSVDLEKHFPEFDLSKNSYFTLCVTHKVENTDVILGTCVVKKFGRWTQKITNQCTPSRNWGVHVKRYLR